MPERSKGEVLRTSGVDSPRGFEPRLMHTGPVVQWLAYLLYTQGTQVQFLAEPYWFRSVEVSTGGFDPPIPGSNPGET